LKQYLLIIICTLGCLGSSLAQDVVLFEDFEGVAPGWSKSTPHTNEWFILNLNSSYTTGSGALAVSNDGTNNVYSNGGTGSAAWVAPNWPGTVTSDEMKIQFDFRVEGSISDYMSVYLVDLDPGTTVPTPANLNGTNSVGLATGLNGYTNWVRGTITLSAANKSFINSSTNTTLLVFTWENNTIIRNQPPGAIDNVLITATSSATPPLSGDYLVGRTGTTDFGSITQAVTYLNANGLSGDVNFYLTDEEYTTDFETFPLEIGDGTTNPFPGMATYNITFKPDPATNPTPTITKSSNTFTGNTDNHGVFTLWGVSNVAFDGSNTVGGTSRDLTIIDDLAGSISNAPMAIYLAGANESDVMENIEIKHTNLSTSDQTYGYGIVAGLHGSSVTGHFSDEAVFDNITIENNSISRVREAIHIDGADRNGIGGFNSTAYATNIDIIDNEMQSTTTNAIQERGIHLLGVNGGRVSRNTIGNFDQTDLNADVGIVLDHNTQNLVVERNEIFNLGFDGNTTSSLSAHGMDIYTGLANSGVTIKNNVIRNVSGNGASSTANAGYFNPAAIFLGLGGEVGQLQTYTQSGFDIYNNSIYLLGEEMDFLTSVSMGLAIADNTTGVDFRNNIIKNTLGGVSTLGGNASALAIFAQTCNVQFDNLNYNGYHIDANTSYTNNYIGLIGSLADLLTDADTDMASWRLTALNESSSFHGDPGYTSTTNLLPDNTNTDSWSVHGMGQPIVDVNNDFAGVTRPTTVGEGASDLGAYEFTINPSTNPPSVNTQPGPLATQTTYTFSLNERQWVEIEFNAGSDLPDDLSVQLYGGDWPADVMSYNVFNYYIDISATENGNTNYDYNIKFFYDESYLGSVPSELEPSLELTNDAAISGIWMGKSTTINTTENSMSANNLDAFGRFSGTSDASPLPVDWAAIKAYENGNVNVLEWSTVTEINSDKFIIEQSADGIIWQQIGAQKGSGSTNNWSTYAYEDNNPLFPTTYYRIKQVDFDGEYSHSSVVSVTRKLVATSIVTYPNPFHDKLTVYNLPEASDVELSVMDLSGSVKYVEQKDIQSSLELDLSVLKAGLYILQIRYADQIFSRKVMKTR